MNKVKRNVLIGIGIVFIISFILISFRVFTINCTLRVRIEKNDRAAIWDLTADAPFTMVIGDK